MRDNTVIAALPYARGYDRELLVGALGSSAGTEGATELRRIAQPDSGEHGRIRATAIEALSRRTGAADTPVYARALRDRSTLVQTHASLALADVGDERAAGEFLAWLVRKLRRKTRVDTWDPDEVPSLVRYAARNPQILTQLAEVLDRHMRLLQPEEQRWLWRVWPSVFGHEAGGAEEVTPPQPQQLQTPVFSESAPQQEDEEEEDFWSPLRTEALARAQRRALETGGVG